MMTPQLRLLPLREISVRVRNGTPHTIGTPPQAVLDAIGPWRINDGWFADATVRDEYDVLLEDGVLYRIYRQQQRWYVRGMYD